MDWHTETLWTRRRLFRRALGAASVLAVPTSLRAMDHEFWTSIAGGARPHLEVAKRSAAWLASLRIETDHGVAWPWNPEEKPSEVSRSLYTGTPGIVLFLLELHAATRDPEVLVEARAGADELMSWLPREPDGASTGLYSGLAGWVFVLDEAHRVTGDARYRAAAQRGVDHLCAGARRVGQGIEWTDTTDIISGSAGIGLLLLHMHRSLGDDDALAAAVLAGRRLVELGVPAEGGLRSRRMPNFSHGTAGIGYLLARLHEATGDEAFLNAALAAAHYLQTVADRERGGCRVFHHQPGGEDLFYLSWCHGPAGTARLFAQLHHTTGEARWRDTMNCFTDGILRSGVPEQRTPGFWNNVSQCCGDAGVGEYFIALEQRATLATRLEYREMINRVARHLVDRATPDAPSGGLKWVQAENRIEPEWTVPQTGFMQGAAGIGMFFLHLDGLEQDRVPNVIWPDSPFV